MDKIDLDYIISDHCGQPFMEEEGSMVVLAEGVKDALKEAMRQVLVLASEKAKVEDKGRYAENFFGNTTWRSNYVVDKQSILDVEKLII